MTIRVLVNGAQGKMGQETVKALTATSEFNVVGVTGKNDNLAAAICDTQAHVVVDFTVAGAGYEIAKTIIANNAHPVIGTSGFTQQQIDDLTQRCATKQLGGIIVPNFSLGAVLMMKYAQDCVRYFPHVEIIELHHDRKADAPSGTAMKTADMLAEKRTPPIAKVNEKELLPGARGAVKQDIHIHSIRLPGLIAHQEIIFGTLGETFTLRHDTFQREAFMPGVLLACEKVLTLKQLVHGLEHVL
jgi:4-hydroxy-tetrahydrodipicolinate reductase